MLANLNFQFILTIISSVFMAISPSYAVDRFTFKFQDETRQYLLHNEKVSKNSPKPLIVVLHGWRQQGQEVHGEDKLDNQLYSELDELAEREGFINLYPTALHGKWNLSDGADNRLILESGQQADDVG